MRKYNIILFYYLIIFGSISLSAQTYVQPDRLDIEDGLSQGFISAMLQDQEGFLWIGTKNGLDRYDGRHFKNFSNDPTQPYSISSDWVSQLYELGDYLLVGTYTGGLNIFHKKSERFYTIPSNKFDAKAWTTLRVEQVFVDALQNIWIIDGESWTAFQLRMPKDFWKELPEKEALLQEVEIRVYPEAFITGFGNSSDEKHIYALKHNSDVYKINIHSGAFELLESNQNSIVFTSSLSNGFNASRENEILSFQNEQWQICKADFTIHSIYYFEKEQQLWANTDNNLLMFENWSPQQTTLESAKASVVIDTDYNTCFPLIKDQSGIIWTGTGGHGILKLNPRLLKIKKYFAQQSVYARPFMTQEGDIFISRPPDGLLKASQPESRLKKRFKCVWWFEEEDSSLWLVGKRDTVVEVYHMYEDEQLHKQAVFGNTEFLHTAVRDPKTKDLWIAIPSGELIQYNISSGVHKVHSFKHLLQGAYDCYSMTQTANGNWWIGTTKGLIRAIHKGENFEFELIQTQEGKQTGLLNNSVATLLTDPYDAALLWLGTKGGGLHRLDTRDMRFTHLTSKTGLPDDVIYGILPDEGGNLWMSSNKGIIKYNPDSGAIQNFTASDGMQSNEFNTWSYAKARTGELMFGGIEGLNVFHPNDLKANPVKPKVWITSLSVNNQAVEIGDSTGILKESIGYTSDISLPFSRNSISLEFAALEFSTPFKNRFKYYLEGAESPWIHEDSDNKAVYLNLAPGEYTFNVKACNGDGVWSEEVTKLNITILPPWYRTNLAYFLYVALCGFGIWQFFQFQKRRFQLQHKVQLEQTEKERLKELDLAKSRLYTNITHEFRTPLTVISGLASQLEGNEEKKDLIKRNSVQLLNLVNQMLDLQKLESGKMTIYKTQDDIIKFIRYLTESLKSYAETKGIKMHFLSDAKCLMMDFDQEKMTRIYSNLLSNAIKFTPKNGDIYIQLGITQKKDQQDFILKVRDNGIGIAAEKLPHIFEQFYQADDSSTRKGEGTGIGLALVSELTKAMNGSIQVASTEGLGTTFSLTFPISQNAELEKVSNAAKLTKENIAPVFNATSKGVEIENIEAINSEKSTVLIVEDSADVIHYLVNCLKVDYNILVAMNGQEGIEKAITETPDLIISDVMMPIKDGFELCDSLKSDERTSHIPITLLTAKADMEARLEGLQKGADAYLSKPFHQEELLIILNNQLTIRKQLQTRFSIPIEHKITPLDDKLAPAEIDLKIEDAFLQKIRALVEKDLGRADFGMPQLIRGLGMSRSQIYKKVKALTGKSPSVYIRSIRLFHAKKMLETTNLNVSETAYEVGFTSPVYFSQVFYEEFGVRPKETRK